jgi:hypothetical protein
VNLADIAPRIGQARDGLLRDRVENRARKEARIAAARARKRGRKPAETTVFCGKVRYPTEADARDRLRRGLSVYKCKACGGWHHTSKTHVRWAKPGEREMA